MVNESFRVIEDLLYVTDKIKYCSREINIFFREVTLSLLVLPLF